MFTSLFVKKPAQSVADDKATLPINHAIMSSITSESTQADVDEKLKAVFEQGVTEAILQAFLLKAALTGKFHLLLPHKAKLVAVHRSHNAIANTIIKLISNTNVQWSNDDARRFQLEALQHLVRDFDLPLSIKFLCMKETFSRKGICSGFEINNEMACLIFYKNIHENRTQIPNSLSSYKNWGLKLVFDYLIRIATAFEKNDLAGVSQLSETFPTAMMENFAYFSILCPDKLMDSYIDALLDHGKKFKETVSHLKALTDYYVDLFPCPALKPTLVEKIKKAFNAREKTWNKDQIKCIQKIYPDLPKTNFKLGQHPASTSAAESKSSESTPEASAISSQISQFKLLLGKDALFSEKEVGELKALEEVIHIKVASSSLT